MPSALLASVHVRLADLAETLLSPALVLPSEHRAVAMHHLSGFYVDSGDLSRGSHANTANVLSAGALSRAPFFLCLKKKCEFWGSNSGPWDCKASTFTKLSRKFLEFGFHS